MASIESFEEESNPVYDADYDPRSGFCRRSSIYRSLHRLGPRHRIPADLALDAATFVLSLFPSPGIADDKPAFIDSVTGRCLTFSHVRCSALSLAAALHHGLGLRRGDVVLVLSPNSVLYPAIILGVLAAGAVITTANPLNTAAEVARQARDSGAVFAIVAPEEAHKAAAADIPILLTTRSPDSDGPLSAEELMEDGDPMAAPHPETAQSDVAAVLYSSGTTGPSKGVVLTHGNLIAITAMVRWVAEASVPARDSVDVYLGFVPMSHIYGLAFFALGLPAAGATTVVMPRFELGAAMAAVAAHGVTNIPAVPPVVSAIARYGGSGSGYDMSGLRRVGTGAAALGAAAGREFRRKFPWVELREGYGLTESGGAATFAVAAKAGAVGRLLPGMEAKVVGPAAEELGPGMRGELWLRGPTVMKGYLGNEEATAEALVGDGWLRTGDLVYVDQDGYLYVVDRLKELIKHNGYQVAPAELEALLLTHTHIVDAAVVPLEDEETGQVPMAYVVKSPQSGLTTDGVIQFIASQVLLHSCTNYYSHFILGKKKQLIRW
ncbi:4-coumarate--CoA ligase-like 5 [Ananas comosus]|uniref:4-coumarate--CoA ligase n=1 Tax=Ananas comosus TaxID=4615 RepID=A0A199UQI7_ANACO|nr:4-coumarate--CoA ligase-like 5 [Ananas comosus]